QLGWQWKRYQKGLKEFWGPDDEQPLRSKSTGSSLMVSDYLCDTLGRLQLDSEKQAQNLLLPPDQQIP
ncbi:1426_t:CDS:2, partial [Acaulospora morrowiae]